MGEEVAMKFVRSVKHVRYVLGSLSAILFASTAGATF
jgi:hypothetical protein